MKALEILESIPRRYCTDRVCGKLDLVIEELKALENRSCRSCKHCSDDCDDDGEWYCEERFKHIELDFCCNKWKSK